MMDPNSNIEDAGHHYPSQDQGQEQHEQHVEQQQHQPQHGVSRFLGFGSINPAVLKKPSGMLMLINIVLLFLATCIMGGWRGATTGYTWFYFYDGYSFFLATTLIPFILWIIFVLILLFGLDKILTNINFAFGFMINCAVWGVFLIISSSIVLGNANQYHCSQWHCSHLIAAGAFGFLSVLGLGIQAFLHFRELRQ